jgi:hypothetical protein
MSFQVFGWKDESGFNYDAPGSAGILPAFFENCLVA